MQCKVKFVDGSKINNIYADIEKLITNRIHIIENPSAKNYDNLYDGLNPLCTSQLSEILLRCGIDPASVRGLIPDNYLYECIRIEEYTIPDNVKVVGERAFYNCPNLTKLIIPEGVTDLYNDSIVKCGSLTSIVLPSTLEFMGHFVFDECVNLSDVTYNGTTQQWQKIIKGDYTFYRCHKLDYIQCIDGIIDLEEKDL